MEENPFQSPAAHVTPEREESLALDYWRPLTFAFDSPNWFMNILLIGVLQLIPIAGPMAMIGYQYEIIIALLRGGRGGYPDFDFNRFGDYLMRGLWPFLVAMAWSVVIFGVFGIVFAIGAGVLIALVGGATEGEGVFPAILVMYIVGFGAMIVLSMVVQAVMMPLMFRSALEKDFMAGMKLGFALQFLGKTWKELILMVCVIFLMAMVAATVGMLLFCVGVYVTIGAVLIGQAHAMAQLYQLHVSRGGEQVPIAD